MNDALTTLGREAEAEFEEKKSVFIAHVCPVSDEAAAQDYIRRKKAEFADARHNVWGYRMAGDIIVRCSAASCSARAVWYGLTRLRRGWRLKRRGL